MRYCIVTLALVLTITAATEGFAQQHLGSPLTPRRTSRPRNVRPAAMRTTAASPAQMEEFQPAEATVSDLSASSLMDDDMLALESSNGGVHGVQCASSGCCTSNCMPCGWYVPCLADGWIHGEYLMWWPRGMNIPPLVTGGTVASQGVLGRPGTETLLGGQMLDQMYSGARLRVGFWADPCHDYAWEVDGFFAGEVTDRYSPGAVSTGVLARPFFNVETTGNQPNGAEDAELITFPGQLNGTVDIEATSQLYGIGVHGMKTLSRSCECGPAILSCECTQIQRRITGFIGWRHLNFSENLRIREDLTSLLPEPDDGRFLIEDRFETDNRFNGLDLGVMWNGRRGCLSLDLMMRMAIGTNRQNVLINGSTSLSESSGTGNNFQNATGGLLAQRTNIGSYSRDEFGVVPELGITLGYAISSHWRATLGYTFLYWSSVVRPGDQIDRDVNPGLFPPESTPLTGLERPAFDFVESDLWVNGLNLGLERTW